MSAGDPKALRRVRVAGAALSLIFLALLMASGWALMAGYVPSDGEAFASILYLRQQAGTGRTLRSLHYLLASGVMVTGFFYLLAAYLVGDPARDRRGWWLSLGTYLLLTGVCFTGFILPMDQNAYWGTVVRLGIVETMPAIGSIVAAVLRGGDTLNASTLPRFYALHTAVLPFFVGLLALFAIRPAMRRWRPSAKTLARVALAAIVVVVLSYAAAAWRPAPLELEANATDSEYVPRPEWYFMWLFQFGKYVEEVPWVESMVLPAAGLGFLILLPLLPAGRPRNRWLIGAGWCGVWMLLTGLAYYADRDLPPRLAYEAAIHQQTEDWYVDLCYECHGDSGAGDGPESRSFDYETPDLTRAETWQESGVIDMIRAISSGKGDDMPAFRRKLNDRDIVALIDFMREVFLDNPTHLSIPEETEEDA